jgi:hypothetical protein
MLWFSFIVIGLLIGLYLLIFDKEMIRVEWNAVASFVGFMVFVTCLRIAFIQFGLEFFNISLPNDLGIADWPLALVFWEDLFFGGSVYLIHKFIKSKFLSWPLTIAISFMFASGHLYQGAFVAALTSIYPYFISRRFGMLYGFGTVMICHIIYDFMSVYLTKLLPYIL